MTNIFRLYKSEGHYPKMSEFEDYDMKKVVMMTAIGGASLAVAHGLSSVVGDLVKGQLSGETVLNLVISGVLLYLSMNYEIARVLYGWLLLAGVIYAGFVISREKRHQK